MAPQKLDHHAMHMETAMPAYDGRGVLRIDQVVSSDTYGESPVRFDPAAERKLRLKIDLYIVPTVAVLYLFCFIDRTNMGNAKIAGLEAELGFTGYNYNEIISIFYISYVLFEIPANLLCKYVGPGWFLPVATVLFGIASLTTAYVHNYAQMAGVRFLLGVFEAGMLPGCAYYLSRWYRRSELAFRLALYIITAPLAGAFGGLLASAILRLDRFGGLHEWRMIFAIEGIITIGVGLVALLILTDRPETARWLTPEEKEMAVARVKSERVGQTVVLDKMDTKKLVRGIFSPVTLSTSLVFLLNNVTVQGFAFFLPTIVRTIFGSKTTIQQQLLVAPPYLVGVVFMIPFPLMSWRMDRRQVFLTLSAPLVMVGYCMFLGSTQPSVRYAATFVIAMSTFSNGAITNAQVSANVASDTARSAAIGTNVMFGNLGGLISSWAFLPWDAPNYHIGNGLNLAAAGTLFVVALLTHLWMNFDNKRRAGRDVDEELKGLSQQEIEDLDWKHPAFRWRP
ncbi:Major facilitator superfamily domain, general substrate transporter [Metarhizium album ARSEF 1941]|uniref:Major facilitator superfamily domain, general substrate transporter n=1 Tax=Metarhizium album (strain ARSEF 1941) TaxID=1081103 RepID=A0A0B2X7A3_METAS|nr:Major facilitator superfamily domain, general substrate transporter [Metarhizium album ARSEF 1941]KHO01643.1 Major facilitator superfamily domain, general substrate transporter [Metarhizium album ARSEF 1941]